MEKKLKISVDFDSGYKSYILTAKEPYGDMELKYTKLYDGNSIEFTELEKFFKEVDAQFIRLKNG